MKIAIIDDWQAVARSCADWGDLDSRAELHFFEDVLHDEDALVGRLQDFDIIMSMRERTAFTASLIARLPKLKLLSITGKRNLSVDLKALAAHGVAATYTGSSDGGESTAELALALLLAAARHVPQADAIVKAGGFQKGVPMGITLHGRTLGLIGLGRLGQMMAGYGKALGMTVLAWSPNLTAERAAAAGALYSEKEDLLARSDAVSIHMVQAPATTGLIGVRELGLLKPGALLVNTSRGPLVDEAALLAAVNDGRIVAALDVYDTEPLPAEHPLRSARNTILSPHIGYCVRENLGVFYRDSVENVLAFLDGNPIRVLTA
jgi:phosphoglycerate dehydrogenase-like enzyme